MIQKSLKKKYSIKDYYSALHKALRTLNYLYKNKKSHQIRQDFIERIMLAVTEVNGCALCSYGHTKIALEQGISIEEIKALLSGNAKGAPTYEVPALLFAQHYADTSGHPSIDSWLRMVDIYGEEKALGILGAIRMIMIGNMQGIVLGAFASRFKKRPVKESNLIYEITLILSTVILLPTAVIHSSLSYIFKRPVI